MSADERDAPGVRVLLVEDEALNRALVRAIVARQVPEGTVVLREAGTVGEARRILTDEAIDVILLDVRLPDGSGLDLATELRDRVAAEGRGMPLIAILSASVLHEERIAAEAAGADEFLGKSFVPRELVDLLARFAARVADRRDGLG